MSLCVACVPRPSQDGARKKHVPEHVLCISHLLPARVLRNLYFLLKKHRGFWTGSCSDIPRARGPLGTVCPLGRPAPCFHLWSLPVCPGSLWTMYRSAFFIHGAPGTPPSASHPRSSCPDCIDSDLPGPLWG